MTDKEKESENIHLVIPKPQIGDPEEIIDKEGNFGISIS